MILVIYVYTNSAKQYSALCSSATPFDVYIYIMYVCMYECMYV